MKVNVVGKTNFRWLFHGLSTALEENIDGVKATRFYEKGFDLYHFFRPQDLMREEFSWDVPAITSCFGMTPGETDYGSCKRAYDYCQRIICHSSPSRQHFLDAGVDPAKPVVIHTGSDPELFGFQEWDTSRPFTVGYVGKWYWRLGNVVDIKGIELLRDTFLELGRRGVEARLLFVGYGWENTVEEFRGLGIDVLSVERDEEARWPEDYPALYNRMDCVIITSKMEGGPTCVTEALSCGRPIVGTDVGMVHDLITNGINGYICDWSAAALAAGIIKILLKREGLAAGGWREVRNSIDGLTYDSWIQRHKQVYGAVLGALP